VGGFCFDGIRQRQILIIFALSRSPTMAGGLLAAHREYFFEIGGYGKRFLNEIQG